MRHQSSINTNTQAGRILARLKKTPRKCGCRIECKIVGRGDGKTISFYRLMP